MKYSVNVLVFGVIFLIFKANSQVIEEKLYFEKLMQKFVSYLEKSEITGNGLPLVDWSGTVNASLYGVTALGTVNFHSGFVNSIEMASVDSRRTVTAVTDDYLQIVSYFYFENVRLFYDMDIKFTEYTDLGSVMILIPRIDFPLYLTYNYKNNLKALELSDVISFSVNNLELKQYPNNGHTQLINKQIFGVTLRTLLLDSIKKGWKAPLQKYLDAAIEFADYPKLCYYCKQLEL